MDEPIIAAGARFWRPISDDPRKNDQRPCVNLSFKQLIAQEAFVIGHAECPGLHSSHIHSNFSQEDY
jgi:hypothetical protein